MSVPIKHSNLVLYVPFDGLATDASATPATPTVTGTPTYVSGRLGQCAFFDATNESIHYGTPAKLNLAATSALSICAWVYLNDVSNGTTAHVIYRNWSGTQGTIFYVRPGSGGSANKLQINHTCTDGSGISLVIGGTDIPHGQWVHVACSISAGTLIAGRNRILYLNATSMSNVNDVSSNVTGTITNSNKTVGFDAGTNNQYIQHLMVWNTELSANEIKQVYESQKYMFTTQEGTGTSISERTGLDLAFTLSGATWTDGIKGKCISFNGTSDYTYSNVNIGGFRTVSFMLYNETVGTSPTAYDFYFAHNNFRIDGGNSAGTQFLQFGDSVISINYSNIPTQRWHHVCCVSNGASSAMYINNVKYAVSGTMIYPESSVVNLGRWTTGTHYANCKMSHLNIYNHALTDKEVSILYNSYKGQFFL